MILKNGRLRSPKLLQVTTAMLLVTYSLLLQAADKWSIGFNEPFVAQYLLHQGLGCNIDFDPANGNNISNCPSNMRPMALNEIDARLYDLATNQHVGIYREIIPVAMLHPIPGTTRYDKVLDVVDIYENYNLKLVLAFGLTVPSWMDVASNWQPMPQADADWDILKNHLSWEMGNLIKYLWDNERISQDWIRTHLFIEGFNEFDSLESVVGNNLDNDPSNDKNMFSTPLRAAQLQGGIQWVLDYYGIETQMLMPSIVGQWDKLNGIIDDIETWWYLALYYAYGGDGYPNLHLYRDDLYPDGTHGGAARMIEKVQESLQLLNTAIPSHYQNKIFLGEAGAADNYADCASALVGNKLSIPQREVFYRGIAEDSLINTMTMGITFWRLMNLPANWIPGVPCESFFGVVHDDNSGYKQVGIELFNYLKD